MQGEDILIFLTIHKVKRFYRHVHFFQFNGNTKVKRFYRHVIFPIS